MNEEEIRRKLEALAEAQDVQSRELQRLHKRSKRQHHYMKRQEKVSDLLLEISESNRKMVEIDREMKAIRDEALIDLNGQFQVIIDAHDAKCALPKAVLMDTLQTLMSVASAGSPSPTIHYSRVLEKGKKALQKAEKIDTRMADAEQALLRSPFSDIKTEKIEVQERLREASLREPFNDIFADKLEGIQQVNQFEKMLKSGQCREAIKKYYLKEFAVAIFQQHVQDRREKKKGALIEVAKYVCDTLEIPYPFKPSLLTGVLNEAKTNALLDAVKAKSIDLIPCLKDEMDVLSRKSMDRVLSARPDESRRGKLKGHINREPTALSSALGIHKSEKRPKRSEKDLPVGGKATGPEQVEVSSSTTHLPPLEPGKKERHPKAAGYRKPVQEAGPKSELPPIDRRKGSKRVPDRQSPEDTRERKSSERKRDKLPPINDPLALQRHKSMKRKVRCMREDDEAEKYEASSSRTKLPPI